MTDGHQCVAERIQLKSFCDIWGGDGGKLRIHPLLTCESNHLGFPVHHGQSLTFKLILNVGWCRGESSTLLVGGSELAYSSIFSTLVTTVTSSGARVTTVKFLLGLDLYSSSRDQTRPSEPSSTYLTLAILSSDVPGLNSMDNFGKMTMSPLLTGVTILSLACLLLTNKSRRVLLQVW